MWKIFLNNLWNAFGAIFAVAIMFAAIVGAVYLILIGNPVVIFIFAFLFVIATCYIDARCKHHKNIVRKKHMLFRSVCRRSKALLEELENYGYSTNAKHLLELVNTTIKEYEDEYGTDINIQGEKDKVNKILEQHIK